MNRIRRIALWFGSLARSWALARKIQRGELIAVRPGLLSVALGTSSGGSAIQSVISFDMSPPEPASVVAEVEADLGVQWHVRLVKDGITKVIDSDPDPRIAMRKWNAYRKRSDAYTVELYDSHRDVVRGTR